MSHNKYINIRPHHFLCIPGYSGEGYSEEFKLNMDKIVKNLNETTKVKIKLGKDDICSSCNSPDNNVCSAAFVEKIDHKVMDLLNIKENEVIEFSYAMKMLKSKMNPELHRKICKDCIWMRKGYCKDTFRTYEEE